MLNEWGNVEMKRAMFGKKTGTRRHTFRITVSIGEVYEHGIL